MYNLNVYTTNKKYKERNIPVLVSENISEVSVSITSFSLAVSDIILFWLLILRHF
jgi:hypothetical protein